MSNTIHFYEPDEPFGFLSNFYPASIEIDGIQWSTSEHYYQAQKFSDETIRQQIAMAGSPDQAFALSRQFASQVRPDWLRDRVAVMEKVVAEKFKQHSSLAFQLLETKNAQLVEQSSKDNFWGDGGDGHGQNRLGKLLMDLRESLKSQEPYSLVEFVDSAKLPMEWGTFRMHGFIEQSTGKEHLALVYGDLKKTPAPLIRLHSECLTGDALFSARCDCGFQLQRALKNIVEEGAGVLLYLRQEGRGIGLINKIRAYHLQDNGADTVEANELLGFAADMRDYRFCKGMLAYLGVEQVRLMTNNPRKVKALRDAKIDVLERVALQEGKNPHNHDYLNTKAMKLGHMFDASFVE